MASASRRRGPARCTAPRPAAVEPLGLVGDFVVDVLAGNMARRWTCHCFLRRRCWMRRLQLRSRFFILACT